MKYKGSRNNRHEGATPTGGKARDIPLLQQFAENLQKSQNLTKIQNEIVKFRR